MTLIEEKTAELDGACWGYHWLMNEANAAYRQNPDTVETDGMFRLADVEYYRIKALRFALAGLCNAQAIAIGEAIRDARRAAIEAKNEW